MKRRDLIKKMEELGWWFLKHESRHDIYTNGKDIEPVQRHNEVPEPLAKKMLKRVKNNPPKGKK